MSRQVVINRWTGSSGSPTKTNINGTTNRYSTADDPTPGANFGIPVPTSGTNYSFWVATRLEILNSGASTINNIKWFTDGSTLDTGISLKARTATTYIQATGTAGTTGLQLTTGNYSTLAGAPIDATVKIRTNPISVSGSGSAVGPIGDFVIVQLGVTNTSANGLKDLPKITWQWDET